MPSNEEAATLKKNQMQTNAPAYVSIYLEIQNSSPKTHRKQYSSYDIQYCHILPNILLYMSPTITLNSGEFYRQCYSDSGFLGRKNHRMVMGSLVAYFQLDRLSIGKQHILIEAE